MISSICIHRKKPQFEKYVFHNYIYCQTQYLNCEIQHMEAEIGGHRDPNKKNVSEISDRTKSSNRMIYEAQVKAIRQQIGELEEIRDKLGLSQRKMCQLLMVDPSAWNRWTQEEGSAPPHIWRALQWYFALKKDVPGINESYFLGHEFRLRDQDAQKNRLNQVASQVQLLNEEIVGLKDENERLKNNLAEHQTTLKLKQKKQLLILVLILAVVALAILIRK